MMRFYNKVVIDIETGNVEECDAFYYDGPIAECKGDKMAKNMAAEQWSIAKEEIDRKRTLDAKIQNSFNKYMEGNIGFDPQQLAIMRAQFLDQNARQFGDASGMIRSALASRGSGSGDGPVSGDFARGLTALASARAGDVSTGLANIDLANLQQALTNKFNAGSLLQGQSANMNSTFGSLNSGANSALNTYIQSKEQGFGAKFMNSLGAGLGGGLAAIATGGLGGMMGGIPGGGGDLTGGMQPYTPPGGSVYYGR